MPYHKRPYFNLDKLALFNASLGVLSLNAVSKHAKEKMPRKKNTHRLAEINHRHKITDLISYVSN